MDLFAYPELGSWIIKYALQIVAVCLAFKVLFFGIAILYNMSSTLFKSNGLKPIDVSKLARIMVFGILLGAYIPAALFTHSTFKLMHEYTKPAITKAQVLTVYIEKQRNLVEERLIADNEGEELSITDKAQVEWAGVKASATTAVSSMFSNTIATELVLTVVQLFVQQITSILMQILFVLGPFSILFSILPGFEGKFFKWFSTYITMCFIPIVYDVLNGIIIAKYSDTLSEFSVSNIAGSFSMNLVMIVVYLLPFWIAGVVVGSADAGRFLSQTGQLATMALQKGAAGLLSKAGGSAMGKSSQSSSSPGNIASASKDGMTV